MRILGPRVRVLFTEDLVELSRPLHRTLLPSRGRTMNRSQLERDSTPCKEEDEMDSRVLVHHELIRRDRFCLLGESRVHSR